MPRPTADQVLKDVSRLETERFGKRNERLQECNELRFRKKAPKVPPAYADTAIVYTSPALQEEGRQVFALVDAKPVPHLIPPVPEDQALTTKMEKFLMASHDRTDRRLRGQRDRCRIFGNGGLHSVHPQC